MRHRDRAACLLYAIVLLAVVPIAKGEMNLAKISAISCPKAVVVLNPPNHDNPSIGVQIPFGFFFGGHSVQNNCPERIQTTVRGKCPNARRIGIFKALIAKRFGVLHGLGVSVLPIEYPGTLDNVDGRRLAVIALGDISSKFGGHHSSGRGDGGYAFDHYIGSFRSNELIPSQFDGEINGPQTKEAYEYPHKRDPVESLSRSKCASAVASFFAVALIAFGCRLMSYGERLRNLNKDAVWWGGWCSAATGTALAATVLISFAAHSLDL